MSACNTTHGRSVTEIWGRDKMKNVDLWGRGRNKKMWTFWGTKLQICHVYAKSVENRHIMAKR